MMHHKVLIVLAALFGIYRLFSASGKLANAITALLITGIAVTFIPGAMVIGFSVFIIAALIAVLYPVITSVNTWKKVLLPSIAFPVAIANVFALARLPLTGALGFIMLVPLAALLYIVAARLKESKDEIGFLVILSTDALIKFLMSVEWISFQ